MKLKLNNYSGYCKKMITEKIETIIFDLDGTLIDSLSDIAFATNKALEFYDLPTHPIEAYRFFVGDGLATLLQRVVPEDREKIIGRLKDKFTEFYMQNWDKTTQPYPGIISMLNELSRASIKQCILSNKPDSFAQKCVEKLLLDIEFMFVAGQRENIAKKPDPQGALEIAEYCNTAPEHCLFVGDTSVDIETGIAAGMISVGVTWGFRSRKELEEAGAHIIITKPEQLVRYVI